MQGRNVLRAWEDRPEAARYALMLRAEDLPLGKPTELPMTVSVTFTKYVKKIAGPFFLFVGKKMPPSFLGHFLFLLLLINTPFLFLAGAHAGFRCFVSRADHDL